MAGGIGGAALAGQQTAHADREKGEKLESMVARMFTFGRPGRVVLFDAPGVKPTEFYHEPLSDDDTTEAKAAAYAYVVKKLGANLRGRVEDTDLYDQRLLKEVLYRGIRRTDLKVERGENAGRNYPAASSPDDFGRFTNEQLTYLYNQLQIVTAEFQPTRAQALAMTNLPAFCKRCADAIAESEAGGSENPFLFLASFSYPELVTTTALLAARMSEVLVDPSTFPPNPSTGSLESSTQSDSPSSLESSAETSNGGTTSSTESPLDTSQLLSREEAVERALTQSPASSEDSPHEPDGDAAAKELLDRLNQ